MRTLGILAIALLTNCVLIQAQKQLKDHDTKLKALFAHYDIGKKPGVSIAIIERDRPIFLRSYGYANLEYQIKNSSNTRFNAADLAKQFTVFAMLLLQDEGKLSIHDPVNNYLPLTREWPFEITLKQLMEQTSGLRDVMGLLEWGGYRNGDVVTKEDILNIVSKQKKLNFISGSKFEYNRTGFVLLNEVIAKVSGIPFSQYVHERIFAPLQMTESTFVNTHTEIVENRAYSYHLLDDRYVKIPNNSSFVGGTNLYVTIADFAKWLRNMANPVIGKPIFYDYLHTKITLSNGQGSNYTPGIYKDSTQGYSRIHLEGFDHGYTAYMMYLPEHEVSLVCFSNDVDFPINDVYGPIFDWINFDYGLLPVPTGSKKIEDVKLVSKSTAELRRYTGNFLFKDNFSTRKIELENDTLFYSRNETDRTPLVPIEGDHTFKMLFPDNDNIRVTFKQQGDVLEFRELSTTENGDFVALGERFAFQTTTTIDLSGLYRSEEIDHIIGVEHKNGEWQLNIDGIPIILDQIGALVFLPRSNPKLSYVVFQTDEKGRIGGLSLYGGQIKNLYYALMTDLGHH